LGKRSGDGVDVAQMIKTESRGFRRIMLCIARSLSFIFITVESEEFSFSKGL
jgi:hypothetical protein